MITLLIEHEVLKNAHEKIVTLVHPNIIGHKFFDGKKCVGLGLLFIDKTTYFDHNATNNETYHTHNQFHNLQYKVNNSLFFVIESFFL